MDEKKPFLALTYLRRFGTEIEVNSFDRRNRPMGESSLPDGIHYVGNLVQKITGERVLIHKWGHDHNNDFWIVKPDSSCGMEICSPVSKGWYGLKSICRVVEGIAADTKIEADNRCSLHVHVDVSDLSSEQLGAVISWWIKSEPVFMDSVPANRKRNRYCQFLGLGEMFEHDSVYTLDNLVKRLGYTKYGSLNTYHLKNGKRSTIEFRIMENECCKNPYMAKNWIRLIVHFVEMAFLKGRPIPYQEDNPWSGYCWLDPTEVFELLGFDDKYDLSPGLQQVKNWFLCRLVQNASHSGLPGVMSDLARSMAYREYKEIALHSGFNLVEPNDMMEALYSDNFRV